MYPLLLEFHDTLIGSKTTGSVRMWHHIGPKKALSDVFNRRAGHKLRIVETSYTRKLVVRPKEASSGLSSVERVTKLLCVLVDASCQRRKMIPHLLVAYISAASADAPTSKGARFATTNALQGPGSIMTQT